MTHLSCPLSDPGLLPALLAETFPPTALVVGAAVFVLFVFFIFIGIWASQYTKAGPDEVLVISGRANQFVGKDGKTQIRGYRLVRGGGTFVFPIVEKTSRLSLKPFLLELLLPRLATGQGRFIAVAAGAQVRVKPDETSIAAAAESLAGKTQEEVSQIASQIIEGTARSTAGRRTAEEAARNQGGFAEEWEATAKPALASLGLEILSLSVRDIKPGGRVTA